MKRRAKPAIPYTLKRAGFRVVEKPDAMSGAIERFLVSSDDIFGVVDVLTSAGWKVSKRSQKEIMLKDQQTALRVRLTNDRRYPISLARYHTVPTGLALNVASELVKIARIVVTG